MRCWALLAALALAGCAQSTAPGEGEAPLPSASLRAAVEPIDPEKRARAAAAEARRLANLSCEKRFADLLVSEALPGAPDFQERRNELLGRAKGAPSLFLRVPQFSESADPAVEAYRKLLSGSRSPAYTLYKTYSKIRKVQARAREVLLREGYLYAESPSLATGLSTAVQLQHLFRNKELFIGRGNQVLRAERRRVRGTHLYFYADGPRKDKPAHLLFLDRVATSLAGLKEPLHVDTRAIQRELGFSQMRVRRMTDEAFAVELAYGGVWVKTVLTREGPDLHLECESIAASDDERVLATRLLAGRKALVMSRLHEVVQQQIDEQLPFDEPKTEVGQQDGKLRQHWRWAYRYGHSSFEFNEDRYRVFDYQGRPKVPQVCIDFITDTLERAGGSWYQSRGSTRERTKGRLDFSDFEIENQRSVESFIDFAKVHEEWFDVYDLKESERIPLRKRRAFFAHIAENRERYQPADIIIILGLRDDEKYHYHSFFVLEADPVTGMPTLLASNAGSPKTRTWEGEMNNAPRRKILTRIRPRLEWLESFVLPAPTAEASGASAVPRRSTKL